MIPAQLPPVCSFAVAQYLCNNFTTHIISQLFWLNLSLFDYLKLEFVSFFRNCLQIVQLRYRILRISISVTFNKIQSSKSEKRGVKPGNEACEGKLNSVNASSLLCLKKIYRRNDIGNSGSILHCYVT